MLPKAQEAAAIFDSLLPTNQEYLLTLARVASAAEQGALQHVDQQPQSSDQPDQPTV